jgi:hypothetical protein
MHSKKFLRGLLVLSLVATFAIPSVVIAAGDPPVRGAKAIREKVENLQGEIERLNAELAATKRDPDATADDVQRIQDEIDAKNSQLGPYLHKKTAGERKIRKVLRNEKAIAVQKKIIKDSLAELSKNAGTMSKTERERLQNKVQAAVIETKRLQDQSGRKKKQYRRRIGEAMPVHCTEPEVRDPKENKCVPCGEKEVYTPAADPNGEATCVAKVEPPAPQASAVPPVVTTTPTKPLPEDNYSSLRKHDECYTPVNADQTPLEMVVYFEYGKHTTPDLASNPKEGSNRDLLKRAFLAHGDQIRSELLQAGYDKIGKLDATGHASKIGGSGANSPNAKLAFARADEADTALLGFLSLPSNDEKPVGSIVNLASNQTPAVPVGQGPKGTSKDYQMLEGRKVTSKDIEAKAKEILHACETGAGKNPVCVPDPKEPDLLKSATKKLTECCSANQATLKYQPFQYTEIKVYGVKFKPDLPACTQIAKGVSDATVTKPVDEEPVNDAGTVEKVQDSKTSGSLTEKH